MKTNSKAQAGVKVTTKIKAGGFSDNHNRKLIALSVKSGIKAGEGIYSANHNRRLSDRKGDATSLKDRAGVKVTTKVKAGGFSDNHNRKLIALSVKSGIKAGEGIYAANHSRRLA